MWNIYKVKMKVIKFGKKSCPPCEAVDSYLRAEGIDYISINPETEDLDEQQMIIDNKVVSIPVTILVDDKGNVLTRKAGYNEKALSHLIELYKNGQ